MLARRKLREIQAKLKVPNQSNVPNTPFSDETHKEKAIQQMQQMSSAQIVSASVLQNKSLLGAVSVSASAQVSSYPSQFWQPALHGHSEE